MTNRSEKRKQAVEKMPRRTHPEMREEADSKMIAAAIELIAERGIERFTLAQVGERAGYSRGLPGHYFGSKEALLEKVAGEIIARFFSAASKSIKDATGLKVILESAGAYIDAAEADPTAYGAISVITSSALVHEGIRKVIRTISGNFRKRLATHIRKGIENREIHAKIDPDSHATLIVGQLRGLMSQWVLEPEKVNVKKVREQLLTALQRSLSAK
jgi:AcrR family transcriptional regulator